MSAQQDKLSARPGQAPYSAQPADKQIFFGYYELYTSPKHKTTQSRSLSGAKRGKNPPQDESANIFCGRTFENTMNLLRITTILTMNTWIPHEKLGLLFVIRYGILTRRFVVAR